MTSNSTRHQSEIEQFQTLWTGGYYEGDPLDAMAQSGYGPYGYMSALHATYLCCIRPHVNENTRVLEIGPGRGAWTRCFVERRAKKVWALDALSAEHNGFWEYVGRNGNVEYFQVTDNCCTMVPDDSIDYFFSFGVFCHISPQVTHDYIQSVFRKMCSGAIGFLMVADYDKYQTMLESDPKYSIRRAFVGKRLLPLSLLWDALYSVAKPHRLRPPDKSEDQTPRPGRWYHLGTQPAAAMLEGIGFEVIDADVGVNHRDPVLHFRKP